MKGKEREGGEGTHSFAQDLKEHDNNPARGECEVTFSGPRIPVQRDLPVRAAAPVRGDAGAPARDERVEEELVWHGARHVFEFEYGGG